MLFDDLWNSGCFLRSVQELCTDMRERFGLPQIQQLGLVVPSVEQSAQELEARGIGPFFIAKGAPVFWKERGVFRSFEGKIGLAYYQDVQLELLEPGQGSDFYRNALDPQGRIVVHHIGFLVQDVETASQKLEMSGYAVWVRGRLSALPLTIDFAYMDTRETAGLILEFITWRFLRFPFSPRAFIVHTLGRLEKWTGKRTLSL